jgi:hypothetical protein
MEKKERGTAMVTTVQSIISEMQDTEDPIVGAVFEKRIETSFENFVLFLLSRFPALQITRGDKEKSRIFLLYNGGDHVGTYNTDNKAGVFGGIRIGSQNPWLKPGAPSIKNPFSI